MKLLIIKQHPVPSELSAGPNSHAALQIILIAFSLFARHSFHAVELFALGIFILRLILKFVNVVNLYCMCFMECSVFTFKLSTSEVKAEA